MQGTVRGSSRLTLRPPAVGAQCPPSCSRALRAPGPIRSRVLTRAAKRSSDPFSSGGSDSMFGFHRQGENWRVAINKKVYTVEDRQVQQWALPTAAVVGMSALIFGPIIIGISVATTAIGFAMTIGSFVLPLVFFGIGASILGTVAVAGFGMFFPLVMAGGIALLGGMALMTVAKGLLGKPDSPLTGSPPKNSTINVEVEDPDEAEMRRRNQELRDFDSMLADRDSKKRMENWSNSKNVK